MDYCARRPWHARGPLQNGGLLDGCGRSRTEAADRIGTRRRLGDVVSGDDPGAGDRVFAKFHGSLGYRVLQRTQSGLLAAFASEWLKSFTVEDAEKIGAEI